MTKPHKIVVGSRGSKLAVLQAELVLHALQRLHPEIEFSHRSITTAGDRNVQAPLEVIGGEGIFVKELEQALLQNEIDLAVHSLKDMPTVLAEGLTLAAVPVREDPRDTLITSNGQKLVDLPPGSVIGTGSARGAVEIQALRRDLEIRPLRGNMDTRLKKATTGEFAGVILAAAALSRLGWQQHVTEYLPADHFLPAVGQGALGIETRASDRFTIEMVRQLDHPPSHVCVLAERAFLKGMGGGCRAPIAALATTSDGHLQLKGMVAGVKTYRILRDTENGPVASAEELGLRLARRLLEQGAAQLITEAKS